MTSPWLSVIGIGEDGRTLPQARDLLSAAQIIYGSPRHFDLAGPLTGEKRSWPTPFASVFNDLKALAGLPVCILATGDPQWFGIGASLTRHFDGKELRILPSPSAFQLVAARMHWPLQEVETLSLHGKPIEQLGCFLYPGARIIALTSNGRAPEDVAKLLTETGYGLSKISVFEHMGGPLEKVSSGTARTWHGQTADFNTLALELVPDEKTMLLPRIPGLPDQAFAHDGKMTKREIRAATLAALMPHPDALLWDIGAGCGSISIEWMRAARGAKAIGLEPHETRRRACLQNARTLGVPDLEVRACAAPSGLQGLPDPDAIFIGGGLSSNLIELCFGALKPGGRLVANAVTVESETILLSAFNTLGGEMIRLSIHKASPVGKMTGWKPLMPVTQWSLIKSRGAYP